MTITQTARNPFALLMNPEAIFAAVAGSQRLADLHSRVCRPLDKPTPVRDDQSPSRSFEDGLPGMAIDF